MNVRSRIRQLCAAAVCVTAALLTTAVVSSSTLRAQTPPATEQSATPKPPAPGVNASVDSLRAIRGASLRVSLFTYGAGELVWEKFGHDAIGIRDTVTGRDVAYNWGIFDFQSPNFLVNFLTGETNYWMAPYNTADYNQLEYVDQNRSVRVQSLAMTSVEKAALLDFVIWNSQEANKFYRYDYYQDNCATRVRDALNWVLSGRLKAAMDTMQTTYTWRSETERSTAADPLVYPGIELALGRNADNYLTAWQASFMPERLADAAAGIILTSADGQRYNLVSNDSLSFKSTRVPVPIDAPDRTIMATLFGLTIAGVIALLADSRIAALRGLLVFISALWYLVGGVLGTALLIAGTATKHVPYMGSNTTLWQIHPLLLFAALFIPAAFSRREATQSSRILAGLIALFSVFGLLLQVVPGYRQHSGVVLAVMVPIHLVLAFALLRLPVGVPRRRASGTAAMSRAA